MIDQFWLFHCGWFVVPSGIIVKGGGLRIRRLPFLGAVAHHSERGPILVDAPFGREGPSNVGELFGAMLRSTTMKFKPEWGVVGRLEQAGFRSAEVNDVLMTHLHWDHAGGMKELAHATFHMRRTEWEHSTRMADFEAVRHGYVTADFGALGDRVEFLDLDDETELAGGFDVFGDGSVEAIPLPGHSPGHTGYRFHLADSRRILFAGDAAFSLSQVEDRNEFGMFPRVAASDVDGARATLRSLRQYRTALEDPEAETLLVSHDFELGERCVDGPIALHTS